MKKCRYSKLTPNPGYRPAYNKFVHRVIFQVHETFIDEYIFESRNYGWGVDVINELKPEAIEWFENNGLKLFGSDGKNDYDDPNQAWAFIRQNPKRRWYREIVVGFTNKADALKFRLAWG